MKRNKTTKMTAVLLCAAMLLMALVSGCGGGGAPSDVESAKEALLGTWYNRYENDEGEVTWADTGITFYGNGTCQDENGLQGAPWYTWELLDSEETGKYTLMLEEKKAFSSQKQYVCEIQFDGHEHFTVLEGDSYKLTGSQLYKDKSQLYINKG